MSKYTTEIKLAACKEYFERTLAYREICQKYGIHFNESRSASILNEWIIRYQELVQIHLLNLKEIEPIIVTKKSILLKNI